MGLNEFKLSNVNSLGHNCFDIIVYEEILLNLYMIIDKYFKITQFNYLCCDIMTN